MITEGSTVYEYKFDGYFSDEACSTPFYSEKNSQWIGTGSYSADIQVGMTGDITVYVKMDFIGEGAVWPW